MGISKLFCREAKIIISPEEFQKLDPEMQRMMGFDHAEGAWAIKVKHPWFWSIVGRIMRFFGADPGVRDE